MADYAVGSKVVHPWHGAGTVVGVTQKSIGEITNSYYVIDTAVRAMQVMVPVHRAEELGLRGVGDPSELRDLLSRCEEEPPESASGEDLRSRQASMRDRLKSGDFETVVSVVAVLHVMKDRRPLGTVDRQLLDQGREFLAGELGLAASIDVSDAMAEVESALDRMILGGAD